MRKRGILNWALCAVVVVCLVFALDSSVNMFYDYTIYLLYVLPIIKLPFPFTEL